MALIIKSGKLARYLTGPTRNLVFSIRRERDTNVARHGQALCKTISQRFASTIQRSDQNLDRSIKKLDQDVNRNGRISRRDVEEVLEEIRQNRTATSSQSVLVIRYCGNLIAEELPENRTTLVQELWQTLNCLSVPMDISHYDALLGVYLENRHPFSPTDVLADLQSKGLEPNRVTYQRLISGYCQVGDINGATQILELMRAKQYPINEHVFNALIIGHSEAGDIELAISVLSVMKQKGLEPTSETYTVLLCAYAKHNKMDEILSTLDKCEANDIRILDKDLFEVIYQLATNGHSDFVDKVIPRLRKSAGYNQDAVNLILRLVNKGGEDVAFKILKTMPRGTRPDGELSETGAFFIKQLIKSGRPTEKVLSICRELQGKGLNNRATLIAIEMATKFGIIESAVHFFKEIQQKGLPLRQHYFRPLINARGKIGPDAVLDVLRVMQSEFNMTANGETLRDYVLPNLRERNYEKIVSMLRSAGTTTSTAVTSCVYDALIQGRINEAATLASTYTIYYQPGLLKRPLVEALIRTSDYRSFISILRSVYENLPRLQQIQNAGATADEHAKDTEQQMQSEIVGQFVVDAVVRSQKNRAEATQQILLALVEEGLSLPQYHSEHIQQHLGSLTPEISILLNKLTSGKLEPVPYASRATRIIFSDLAKYVEKKTQEELQRIQLQTRSPKNDVHEIGKIIESLSKSNFALTSGLYPQLIDFYINNSLDKALAVYTEIKSKHPDFILDYFKTIKVVHEFIANDRVDEAIEFLKSGKPTDKLKEDCNSLCSSILNRLANNGRDFDVNRVFSALEENNLIEANSALLGPLVKVHLVNNDVMKALSAFEVITAKYNCTPCKNELSCKLIQLGDVQNLELLTSLSTNVDGEVNSLYDLVFSFVECGGTREARKILETTTLPNHPQRVKDACERYRREGRAACLEALVQVTKGVQKIDRAVIFQNLLLTYCDEGSPEKALSLWKKIRIEGLEATYEFSSTLARFLKEKSVEIPFVAIDADSQLLEMMVQEDRLDSATQHVMKMVEANTYPLPRIFRFYLIKMAETGNYETLEKLSPRLSVDIKAKISFDNRLGRAYSLAGKSEQFLYQSMKEFTNATNEELKDLIFPSGAILTILDKHPKLISKFEKFALGLAERGVHTPINVLWMTYIENGKLDQADRIMKSYLCDSPKIMFNSILKSALRRNDETIALNLLEALKDTKVAENDLATVHNCLLDVYCSQRKYDKALRAVGDAIKDVGLKKISRTALVRVKDGLEAEGIKFPHNIPIQR